MIYDILKKYIPLPKNGTLYLSYNTERNKFFLNIVPNNFFNDYLFGLYNQRAGTKRLDDEELRELIPRGEINIIKKDLEKIKGKNLKLLIYTVKDNKIVDTSKNASEFKKLNFSREPFEFITDVEDHDLSVKRYDELLTALKTRNNKNPVYKEAMVLLKKYIGTDKFTIPFGKNRKKTLRVHYEELNPNTNIVPYYAAVFTDTPLTKKGFREIEIAEPELQLKISYHCLTVPKKVIDTIIAHELTHAVRSLNKEYSSIYYMGFWNRFEEFMADRGIKEQLPLIRDTYKNKADRQEALRQSHKILKSRWLLTLGPITWLFEWKDRFTGFSNIKEYVKARFNYRLFSKYLDNF